MTIRKVYTGARKKWCVLIALLRIEVISSIVFLLFFPSYCFGQEKGQYDEIAVYIKVPGIGGSEIPALIKNEIAYLSVSDVFTLLKIKNIPSARLDSLSGFFINLQDEYLIDRVNNRILFQKKKFELKPDDLILTETNLYMKTTLFGEVFGLNCQFNIRDLSVSVTTNKLELPTIRELKMEQMRENLKRLRGEVKTDTTIGRSYPLFKFGMADWSINTTQQQKSNPSTQLNLSLGSVIAGGEMNLGLYYDQANRFDSKQQNYLWRYANNEFSALRQVLIGKIPLQSISMSGSIIGIQVNNTPTIFRRSFGTYTLTDGTEPGWLVELYINNVLVDYVKADASGFYKFEVPLTYGNSVLKVRMYGPGGEVKEKIQASNIPYNFVPPGELEYSTTFGVLEDSVNNRITRTDINYGISRKVSIGGGYEYYSSPKTENSLPFIRTSLFVLKNFLVAGEYTFGTRLKSSISYHLPSNFQLNFNYTGYEKGQRIIKNAPLQSRDISISAPFQRKSFSLYSMLSVGQMIYTNNQTTVSTLVLSGNLKGVNMNVTSTSLYFNPKIINTTSNVSFSFRLPKQFVLRPSVIYDYTKNKWTSTRWQIDKPFFGNGYLTISYNRDFLYKLNNSLEVGFRLDCSFMQTSFQSHLSKSGNSFSQTANGSLMFDRRSRYVRASNSSMVGRSGFTFYAFLDLNGNGKRDKNEPKVLGLSLRLNGGRIVKRDKDSTIRVIDLMPYTSYLVEISNTSFQNIAWKVKNKALSVYADPNQFKTIEIPVDVMSEATGTVSLKSKKGTRGLGRVYVNFYRNDGSLFGRTLTEGDGYYSFMGLKPGNYIARMDSSQLEKIKMTATPEFKTVTVKSSKEGEFIEGLDFTLQSTVKDSMESVQPSTKPKTVPPTGRAANVINYAMNTGKKTEDVSTQTGKDRIGKLISNSYVTSKPVSGGSDLADLGFSRDEQFTIEKRQGFSIQMGSYIFDANALAAQRKITEATGISVVFVEEDGFIKLWIDGFATKRAAEQFVRQMAKMGLHPSYIIRDNRDIQILAFE